MNLLKFMPLPWIKTEFSPSAMDEHLNFCLQNGSRMNLLPPKWIKKEFAASDMDQ